MATARGWTFQMKLLGLRNGVWDSLICCKGLFQVVRLLIILFLTISCGTSAAADEAARRRVAVVVGVNSYNDATLNLNNPGNDAREFASKLIAKHSFADGDVHVLISDATVNAATKTAVLAKWESILSELEPGDVVVFYFAGHGLELKGRYYLLPSDAQRSNPEEKTVGALTFSSLDLQDMIYALGQRQRQHEQDGPPIVGIFIIDACRENPFIFSDQIDARPVGLEGDNLKIGEVFIMYSAGIGQFASDGRRGASHSVFAEVLLKHLDDTKLPLNQLAQQVKTPVHDKTRRILTGQTPAYYDQLTQPRTIAGYLIRAPRILDNVTLELIDKLEPGDTFKECLFCPDMVTLDGGKFSMGSDPKTDTDATRNEQPRHDVTIPRAFAMARHEVTNSQWDTCVRDGDCSGQQRSSPKNPNKEQLPVADVSWEQAQKFIGWLNKVTKNTEKNKYRLPTEAEWEYAARAGTTTPYSFKDQRHDEICRYANGADSKVGILPYAYRDCSDGFGRTVAPVGSFKDNAWGLHDMHGNVWEWTQDCWHADYADPAKAKDGLAWETKACPVRVARGGSWRSGRAALRSATRNAFAAGHSRPTLGFRVVRDINQ